MRAKKTGRSGFGQIGFERMTSGPVVGLNA
jgi:hypothetical protein